jgi:hypothetical protein
MTDRLRIRRIRQGLIIKNNDRIPVDYFHPTRDSNAIAQAKPTHLLQ